MLQYELDALQSRKIVLWVFGFFWFSTWTIKRTFPLTLSRRCIRLQILEKVIKEFFRYIMFAKAALHLGCLVSPSHFYNDGVLYAFFLLLKLFNFFGLYTFRFFSSSFTSFIRDFSRCPPKVMTKNDFLVGPGCWELCFLALAKCVC